MYFLTGSEKSLETIFLLSKSQASNITITTEQELRQLYLNFLKKIQPNTWHPEEISDQKFIFDQNAIVELTRHHQEDTELSDFEVDLEIVDEAIMREATVPIQNAIEILSKTDDGLYQLFNIAINTLFYVRSLKQAGGSVSSSIGVIWCGNRKNWTVYDIMEFLVHELTHNLVFLDELRYKHYLNFKDIASPDNYAISAVLRKLRPLDKVFHSLVVAVEVLCFRVSCIGHQENTKVHPSSDVLYKSCLTTLSSLNSTLSKKELVYPRVYELLALIEDKLNSLKNDIPFETLEKLHLAA